jgi:hypothetical protein
MGVTISTHNGSKVAREHNIRNPKVVSKEPHIQQGGKFEIWTDEKPQDAYKRIFGQAVEDYNAKQKRIDRQITDYYKHICNDKVKHPVYEMIIAVGDRNDYKDGILTEETAKSILREFVDGWQERNPNLVLIGAYYHADEQGVPHAHLDYIPVATGYKRGLETQSALVKALEQQGFIKDGKETAQIQWERRENAHLEKLCLNRSIEVTHPLIEGRQHLETEQYKLQAAVVSANLEKQASEYIAAQAAEEEKTATALAIKAEEKAKEHNNARKLLKAEKKSLQTEIECLTEKIDTAKKRLEALQGKILNQEQVNSIKGKKTLTGALKGVSFEDFQSLKKTAEKIQYYENAERRLWERENETEKRLQDAENLIKLRLSEIDELTEMAKSLITSNDIAKKLKQAEKEKNLINRELIRKNADIIRKKQNERLPGEQKQPPKRNVPHR